MNASQQAAQWAQKKKEMMEKAARQKEERKQQLQNMGERALATNNFEYEQKPRTSNSQSKQQQQDYYQEPVTRQYSNAKQQQQMYSQSYGNQKVQKEDYGYNNTYTQYPQQQSSKPQIRQPPANYQPPAQLSYNQNSNVPPKPVIKQPPPPARNPQQQYQKPPSQEGRRALAPKQPEPRQPEPRQAQNRQPAFKQQPATNYYNPIDDIPLNKGNGPQLPAQANEPLYECSQGCGRSFAAKALQKHEPICVKVFQKKRKEFNVQQQRIVSNEQVIYLKNQKQIEKKYQKAEVKKKDWKKQSEAFRAIIKQARGGQLTKAQQVLIVIFQQVVAQASQMDYIQCPHCGRKFNEQAGTRHIPSCAQRSKIPPRQMRK